MAAGRRSTNLWRAGDVAAVRVMSSALGKTGSSCRGLGDGISQRLHQAKRPIPVVRAAQLSAVPMVHHRNMASILARTRADAVNVAGTAVCDLLAGRQQHDLILDEVEAPWRSAPAHDQVRDLLNGAFKC
jgi:hypothetical protein